METVKFEEKQGFSKTLLVPITLIIAVIYYAKWHDLIWKGLLSNTMLIQLAIIFVVLAIIYAAKLTVRIMEDNRIEYRFFPFHLKTYEIKPQDISDVQVRSYTPWGGGIRYNFFERMTAYILAGTKGLEVKLHNGRKVLFGTPRAPEMLEFFKHTETL